MTIKRNKLTFKGKHSFIKRRKYPVTKTIETLEAPT